MTWTRPLPAVSSRMHFDSGHDLTSWTGELRAVVDDEHLVVRVWGARKGWRYRIEWRYGWEKMAIMLGPLRRGGRGRRDE